MRKAFKLFGVLFTAVALFTACGKEKETELTTKYPSKAVNVIVAYKAGGGTDVGARILVSEAQKSFSQPFVIVNKPGQMERLDTQNY